MHNLYMKQHIALKSDYILCWFHRAQVATKTPTIQQALLC